MKTINEINSLISIRNYMINVINNSSFDRSIVNDLNGMLILTDKKIVELLRSDDFKDYINFKDVKKAIKEVVDLNNIKSGLNRGAGN